MASFQHRDLPSFAVIIEGFANMDNFVHQPHHHDWSNQVAHHPARPLLIKLLPSFLITSRHLISNNLRSHFSGAEFGRQLLCFLCWPDLFGEHSILWQ